MADFLVSALLLIANLLSLLFDHAARTVHATMPAVPAMMLASSALGFLAMRIDKAQAAREGWRLSERSIVWYSVTGGGPEYSRRPLSIGTRRSTGPSSHRQP